MTNTTNHAPAGIDLDTLEALARAATPGPWALEDDEVGEDHAPFCHVGQVDEYDMRITVRQSRPITERKPKVGGPRWRALAHQCLINGEFIAAANPETVLALIALARRAAPDAPAADERALFEAWYRESNPSISAWRCAENLGKDAEGKYFMQPIPKLWAAWQASRATHPIGQVSPAIDQAPAPVVAAEERALPSLAILHDGIWYAPVQSPASAPVCHAPAELVQMLRDAADIFVKHADEALSVSPQSIEWMERCLPKIDALEAAPEAAHADDVLGPQRWSKESEMMESWAAHAHQDAAPQHLDRAGLNQFIELYCGNDSRLIACAEAAWNRCMSLNAPTEAAVSPSDATGKADAANAGGLLAEKKREANHALENLADVAHAHGKDPAWISEHLSAVREAFASTEIADRTPAADAAVRCADTQATQNELLRAWMMSHGYGNTTPLAALVDLQKRIDAKDDELRVNTHSSIAREAIDLTLLRGARGMLDTVAACASHDCEDCREHAAKHRDRIDAVLNNRAAAVGAGGQNEDR
jgi:hypothetical protein